MAAARRARRRACAPRVAARRRARSASVAPRRRGGGAPRARQRRRGAELEARAARRTPAPHAGSASARRASAGVRRRPAHRARSGEDERGDVADRPLALARARAGATPLRMSAPSESRGVQRAVAAAADVRLAAPVDELVAGGGRQQDLARGRAGQRRPHARERVGIGGGLQDVRRCDARVDRGERALDAPAAPRGSSTRRRPGRSAARRARGWR